MRVITLQIEIDDEPTNHISRVLMDGQVLDPDVMTERSWQITDELQEAPFQLILVESMS